MTYELGVNVYASAWIAITAAVLALVAPFKEKMGSLFGEYVNCIDQRNGDLGLDRSVDVDSIARDHLIPIGGKAIDAYVGRNDFPRERYVDELNRNVGRPIALILFASLFVVTILLAFAGPLVYYLWGTSYLGEYLIVLYSLVGANLFVYFLL